MRQLTILTTFLVFCFSCSNTKTETTQTTETTGTTKFPFTFVNTKTEANGNSENKMDLYSVDLNLNLDTLKMFCKNKKNEWTRGTFYFVVFFDKGENAVFPNNPLTALYIEDEPLKHIKAVYTYNRINGYSKLGTYEKNMLESIVNEVDI